MVVNCPNCDGQNTVVEVRSDVSGSFTSGFWCLKCDAKWNTQKKFKEYEHAQNYFLQMTAYAEALEEMTGEKVEALTAMVVLESGHFQLFECQPKLYLKEFIKLRDQYRNLYGR